MDYGLLTKMESGSALVLGITRDMESGWYSLRGEDGAVESYIYSNRVFLIPESVKLYTHIQFRILGFISRIQVFAVY